MMLISQSTSKQVGEKSEYLDICTCVHTYKQLPLGPDSPQPCWSLHVLSNDVELLRLLTTQSQYADVVRSGHWMWVYDNLNIHQRVRHERTGERSIADSNSHIHVHVRIYIYMYIKMNVYA